MSNIRQVIDPLILKEIFSLLDMLLKRFLNVSRHFQKDKRRGLILMLKEILNMFSIEKCLGY